jgi:hypothetical protein
MLEIFNFVVAVNQDDRLEVLATLDYGSGPGRRIWRARQTARGDWTRGEISSFPLMGFQIDMKRNADGRLEAVGLDDNGTVLRSSQVQPGGDWSEWQSLGTPDDQRLLSGVALTQNKDGRLGVFTTTNEHAELWHSWQPTPGRGPWTPWASLGCPPGVVDPVDFRTRLVVGRNKDGRLEVFCTDGRVLWHIWQRAQGWSDWSSLGHEPPVGELAVRATTAGRLVLVATTYPKDGSEVWQREQVAPNGGWSPWVSLGRLAPTQFWRPRLVAKADGQLQLLMKAKQELLHFREARWTPPQSVTF